MLLVAAVLGAASLSTSYAFVVTSNQTHSLHRTIRTVPAFDGSHAGQVFSVFVH